MSTRALWLVLLVALFAFTAAEFEVLLFFVSMRHGNTVLTMKIMFFSEHCRIRLGRHAGGRVQRCGHVECAGIESFR
jgi:hypothetical protein